MPKVSRQTDAAPYSAAAAVTPHNSNELGTYARALWIGGAGGGALKVTTVDGSVIAFAGVPVGWFPIQAKIVWATGTDVTDIVAVW